MSPTRNLNSDIVGELDEIHRRGPEAGEGRRTRSSAETLGGPVEVYPLDETGWLAVYVWSNPLSINGYIGFT